MRTYKDSCVLLDKIVGRCVRDAEFAAAVLEDPATVLKEYQLNEHELEDFLVLRADHKEEAAEVWQSIRDHVRAQRVQ